MQNSNSVVTEQQINEVVERIVKQDVIYCVSSLVSEISEMSGRSGNHQLQEQCFNLSESEPDYEQAATDEGWVISDNKEFFEIIHPDSDDSYSDWEDCCNDENIDYHSYRSEVYEHWIVSSWLANKLESHGQVIDHDFMGLTIWGRCTTGQSISMDYVIQQIAKDIIESQN